MRLPEPVGTPIDLRRMRRWMDEYGSYRVPVTEGRIERWLGQFDESDRDLAARLLDVVDFVGNDQVTGAYRAALAALPGWSAEPTERAGRFFFLPFAASGGESAGSMLYRFRHANNLALRRYDSLFPYLSSLLQLAPGPEDTVVLVDDFSGTGDQALEVWDKVFRELLPFSPNVFLVLIAASHDARERIRAATDMVPYSHIELTNADYLFREECNGFSAADKARILRYCKKADPRNPRGYGECGFVIVLVHKSPNNTLPILHASRENWEGLFRRHD